MPMGGPFELAFDFFRRRPVVLPVAVVVLLGLAIVGAMRIDFEEDIFALLPQDEPLVIESRLAMERFEGLERVVIALESDDRPALRQAVDQADAALREVNGVEDVVSRIDPAAQEDIARLYAGKAPVLFDQPMREAIEARLNTEYFQRGLQRVLDNAAGREGIQVMDTFQDDPFGFREITLRRFENLSGGYRGAPDAQGRILSEDGRLAVLFVQPDLPASDTARGRTFMADVEGALESLPGGVKPHVIGAHRSSVDNAEVIERDVNLTVATSVVGILLLFILVFRALTPIVVTLLSVGFGFAVALGSQGWVHGELSVVTAGFSAVLLGISVDYAVHLVTTYGALDGGREERARGALVHVARPGMVAMITTAAAIVMLRFSSFDGLHQLAEMAVAGIAGALVFAFTAGAQLLRRFGPKPRAAGALNRLIGGLMSGRRRARTAVLAVLGLITLGLAAFLPAVSFEGDVTKLDGKRADTAASEELIEDRFGRESLSRTLVVVSDAELQGALRRNDLAARDLHAMGTEFEGASWVLPSLETQRENLTRWRRFWSRRRIDALVASMAAAEARKPGSGSVYAFSEELIRSRFSGFLDSLHLTAEPGLIDAAELRERPLWNLLGTFVNEGEDGFHFGTIARMDADDIGPLRARQPSAVVLNRAVFVGRMVRFIQQDLVLMGGLSLLLVIVVLWLTFGKLVEVLIALVPVVGGLVWTLGLMGLFGISFNLINTLVTVFVAGLGIDYGIFFVQTWRGSRDRAQANARLRHAGTGVLVAATTTLFGFGSLALARHPALFSVGITTAIGVASALTLTLLVVPTLLEMGGRHEAED